jgi:DNA polymerase III epsilon subunit-like protein
MHPYLAACLELAASGRPLAFLDLETTGFMVPTAPFPAIWEIGVVRRAPNIPEQVFRRVVKIDEPLAPIVAEKCHVDADMPMREGEPIGPVLDDLTDFLSGAILVGQRIEAYDIPILVAAYEAAGRIEPAVMRIHGETIDTRIMSELWFDIRLGTHAGPVSPSQAKVAAWYGLDFDADALHAALADVVLTAAVLEALITDIMASSTRVAALGDQA